MQYVKKIV